MPRFRHPILLAPPETSASTAMAVVTSMVSSALSLNMVFDDRDSPIHATRGSYALGSFRGEAF
jgi:hypothetical protein